MNENQAYLVIGILCFILGIGVQILSNLVFNVFFKKKFKLEVLKDIIYKSDSNLKIINKANENLNKELNNLSKVLEILENAKK